jgi:hypothetical protein
MIKSIFTIENYTKEQVYEAIANVSIRKEWDKIFSEFKVIEADSEGYEILYMSIKVKFIFTKAPVFVKNRDFVQRRKIWKNFPDENSVILHFKSVDNQHCPVKKDFIRANTIISGYYIQTLSTNPLRTRLSGITQTDVKGIIPKMIVNRVAQNAPKEWMKNLLNGCKIVKDRGIV